MPPLTRKTCPVIQRLSGPARKDTTSAMSSGCPRRPNGIFRVMVGEQFLRLAFHEHVGLDWPRRDDVHVDAAWSQLLGEDMRHRLDGCLGRGVYAVGGAIDADHARREADDPTASGRRFAASRIPLKTPLRFVLTMAS